ncbi:MAG: sugar phosphate isomerase/epimerase [Capsulimonadaceae bacterium]|nr:sugar phosphate isomerase/epimerase [Capsulimonadaceae bacterium]
MKPAVITDEIDQNLDRALDVMLEYGVRNAELRQVYDCNVSAVDAAAVKRVKRAAEDRGVDIVCLSSPFYKTDLPGAPSSGSDAGPLHGAAAQGFDEQIAMLRRLIDVSAELGASLIRTFTFWKHGEYTEDIEERIAHAYREPARIAADAGIRLLIENEPSCYAGTGREVARLIERIGSDAVKAVWDPANVVYGQQPLDRADYDAIRPHIAHVHFKDACYDAPGASRCVLAGEGFVDWPEQFRWLQQDGYDGYVALETHSTQGGKEAASRNCLTTMLRLLEETS